MFDHYEHLNGGITDADGIVRFTHTAARGTFMFSKAGYETAAAVEDREGRNRDGDLANRTRDEHVAPGEP